MTHPSAAALTAHVLHKRFLIKESGQTIHAVADITLAIQAGTLTALVGPDGAGKTTLLRMMAGLMKPDEGQLHVLGIDVAANPQAIQDRISYMPQRFGLYEDLSVQENLDLYADLHGVPQAMRLKRYARLLEMTNLARFTARLAGQLSGGMKQKLGLACTLVRLPELLLLDEPTVGVDPLSRRELWEIVQQMIDDEQLTVLVSTAYLDEAERCARVFVLHEGKLVAQGSPAEIRHHARSLCFIVTPPQGQPPRFLQTRLLDNTENIIDAVPQGGAVRFIRRPGGDQRHLDALLGGAPVTAVEERLEDGFMMLLHKQYVAEPRETIALKAAVRLKAVEVESLDKGKDHAGDVIIEVRDLVRRFGDFTAVDNISFSIRRGEIFGVLGPNGAGKTTTFRMLCGLLPASSGFLRVAGVDLRHARAIARRKIGYVSQKFALYGDLSVMENLEFFGSAYGLSGERLRERIAVVMRQFDLQDKEKSPSGQLPGGYKQRLAMAVGLLHEPDILFLDEPTSGTDPQRRREFWRRITALSEVGTTIIITTHFMEEAEYCDRIVIQDAGKLLALGTPQEVRTQAGGKDSRLNMEEAFISIVEQGRQRDNETAAMEIRP
ncbi:heme ABC exporter ATP-binding protein CcmA [Nitrosospira lacus]|uniref:Heme ABC exporter ATP-binding protein CcmA n=1 Tax=Nitrosospira lacus TaxID=1288494 RepID=A0A1W6SQ06_9PROT|nr:ATP-binding cassette domain-containing protein [Nitrosospira lacus]ARO87875.1 heme ABC exporter ATP-binding protein CcmA [Nitrosospira lacus]